MTATERRTLVTHLVARVQEYMLSANQDNNRISCFERTGCLITTQVCHRDAKIKPQGVTVPFIVPVLPPPEVVNTEEEIIEAQDDTIEMQRMAAAMGDMELEDNELILNNDIANDIGEGEEI